MLHQSKSSVKGKLILCGEHAVLFGGSAITFSAPNQLQVVLELDYSTKLRISSNTIHKSAELSSGEAMTTEQTITKRHQLFVENKLNIAQVFQNDMQLIIVTIVRFFRKYHLQHGLSLNINSNIPVGSGMGSSAAVIVSCLQVLYSAFNIECLREELLDLAIGIEKLQHGKTFGMDVLQIVHGGLNYCAIANNTNSDITFNPIMTQNNDKLNVVDNNFYIVNSGRPRNSTGEVVQNIKINFGVNHTIWQELKNLSAQWVNLLPTCDDKVFKGLMAANQHLLNSIGIAPKPVQQFVELVELAGGAAKISGAGGGKGDTVAGLLLVVIEDYSKLTTICQKFGYQIEAKLGAKWRKAV